MNDERYQFIHPDCLSSAALDQVLAFLVQKKGLLFLDTVQPVPEGAKGASKSNMANHICCQH